MPSVAILQLPPSLGAEHESDLPLEQRQLQRRSG